MAQARRQHQVGPATYTARQRPGSRAWWVHEHWWEYTRRDDEDDFEEWHGPFDSKLWAEAKAKEWSER